MKSLIASLKGQIKEEKEAPIPEKLTPNTTDLQTSLVSGINQAIAAEIKPRYRKQVAFSPSNTNLCPRYAFYLFNGIEIPVSHDARVQRIFDNGNGMHERYAGYFEKMGVLIEKEYRVETLDPPLNAYIDLIIDWDGAKPVELKSISEAGFMYRRLYQKPKDDHVRQLQLYLHMMDYQSGFVLYENKNNQEILCFHLERDEAFIQKTLKNLRKTYELIRSGVKPARPYKSISSTQCKECALRDLCWSELE